MSRNCKTSNSLSPFMNFLKFCSVALSYTVHVNVQGKIKWLLSPSPLSRHPFYSTSSRLKDKLDAFFPLRWWRVHAATWIWSNISWTCCSRQQQKRQVHEHYAERIICKWRAVLLELIHEVPLAERRAENQVHHRTAAWDSPRPCWQCQDWPTLPGGEAGQTELILQGLLKCACEFEVISYYVFSSLLKWRNWTVNIILIWLQLFRVKSLFQ